MNQRKYALELLVEVGLTRGKVDLIPLVCNMKLTIAEMTDSNGEMSLLNCLKMYNNTKE